MKAIINGVVTPLGPQVLLPDMTLAALGAGTAGIVIFKSNTPGVEPRYARLNTNSTADWLTAVDFAAALGVPLLGSANLFTENNTFNKNVVVKHTGKLQFLLNDGVTLAGELVSYSGALYVNAVDSIMFNVGAAEVGGFNAGGFYSLNINYGNSTGGNLQVGAAATLSFVAGGTSLANWQSVLGITGLTGDVSGKANLAGGNEFTETQKITGKFHHNSADTELSRPDAWRTSLQLDALQLDHHPVSQGAASSIMVHMLNAGVPLTMYLHPDLGMNNRPSWQGVDNGSDAIYWDQLNWRWTAFNQGEGIWFYNENDTPLPTNDGWWPDPGNDSSQLQLLEWFEGGDVAVFPGQTAIATVVPNQSTGPSQYVWVAAAVNPTVWRLTANTPLPIESDRPPVNTTTGSQQRERATVYAPNGCTSDGVCNVVVSGMRVVNSPVTVQVILTAGVHTTSALIAAAINQEMYEAFPWELGYTTGQSGGGIDYFELIEVEILDNDPTFNIAISAGLGINAAPDSTTVVAGAAPTQGNAAAGLGQSWIMTSLESGQKYLWQAVSVEPSVWTPVTSGLAYNPSTSTWRRAVLSEVYGSEILTWTSL